MDVGDDDIKCNICHRNSSPSKGRAKKAKKAKKTDWIACDACDSWFHPVCVRINKEQMEKIDDLHFLCEKCCVRGCLFPKVTASPPVSGDLDALRKTIQELSSQIAKLQEELEAAKVSNKKQLDRFRNQLRLEDRTESQRAAQDRLVNSIGEKLDIIEKGAKLASTCSQSVNSFRLAINKIPAKNGENVRALVENVLTLLDSQNESKHVTSCFRLPVKPSKWTDRTISPTIVVVFDNVEARQAVLRRLRNFALRLKQNKAVKSIFVRNDRISVLLPGQQRYIPIETADQLCELTSVSNVGDSSSVFFDCTANVSTSSHC
ncbi:hypothetical protein quinque_013371 [Culex quinquefasciatus]